LQGGKTLQNKTEKRKKAAQKCQNTTKYIATLP